MKNVCNKCGQGLIFLTYKGGVEGDVSSMALREGLLTYPLEVRSRTAAIQQRIPCLTHKHVCEIHTLKHLTVGESGRVKGEVQRQGSQTQPGAHCGTQKLEESGYGGTLCNPEEQGVESTFLPEWSARMTAEPSNGQRQDSCSSCGSAAAMTRH